ncbi:MAG: hypothetical protein J1F68_03670 [Clostridiales bacterium]|nr:hypothetical protein [Clostridiales bacterium]
MKINVCDNVIFSSAKAKVEEGEYFDALCLFARVNSYESMLNQIGCLCVLRDVGYAIELYRNLLAKYYFTHNCNADVAKLGDATEIMSAYFGNDRARSNPDPNKISAEESLLAFYPMEFDDFADADDINSLSEVLEYTVGETSKRSVFYDVKTPDFYLNLCQRMERAYFEGNLAKGRELQRQFLSIDTDDAPTLEMQLFLCFTQQQWERGVQYALRYAALPNATARGMGVCVQILSRSGEEHTSTIEQLLQALSKQGEEITDLAMMDYVQIASSVLGYGEITHKLTCILYGHYKDAGCSALSLCARTFFNCGDFTSARDAILLLLRAVPWDGVASVYLTYFNKHVSVALDGVATSNSLARHFDVPTQLSVIAQYTLLKDMEQNNLVLDSASFPLVKCMFRLCLGCIVKGDADRFFAEAQALSTVVCNLIPQDNEAFFAFAKECLAGVLPEPSLNKDFVSKLIELGYRSNLLIATGRGYYTLDLSRLTVTDKAFVTALGICATLRKVDARRLERAYKQLTKALNMQFESDVDTVRQLAYAMLALSYKRFAESDESTYFSDEEHALYQQYLQCK